MTSSYLKIPKKHFIYTITGPSGSGKTYMAKYIEKTYGIPTIVSYTTRVKRENEVEGEQHYFVDDEVYENHKKEGVVFAETIFGGKHYWTTINDITASDVCTYVIDEKGLKDLWENRKALQKFLGIEFWKIYVDRPLSLREQDSDKKRINRDNDRILFNDSFYDTYIYNVSQNLDGFNSDIDYWFEKEFEFPKLK